MQAVILAGGKGTRLKPYTTILPKPLMPIGEMPILELVITQLKTYGFNKIVLTVGYLAELIEAYFGNGKKWGVEISYSREDSPLGTAGPISMINGLEDDFLVMNGDLLCDLDFSAFSHEHKNSGAMITVCGYTKKVKIDLGILQMKNGVLDDYIEKPVYEYKVSTGIYMLSRKVVINIPKQKYDLPDLIRDRLKSGDKIKVFDFCGQWFDIGVVEDYQAALEKFLQQPGEFLRSNKP